MFVTAAIYGVGIAPVSNLMSSTVIAAGVVEMVAPMLRRVAAVVKLKLLLDKDVVYR